MPSSYDPRTARFLNGWEKTDDASKAAFEAFLLTLGGQGVEIVSPEASDTLRRYEDITSRTPEFFFDLMTFELRWPLRLWHEQQPDAVSDAVARHLQRAASMTVEQYRRACERREELRTAHRSFAGSVDGFITLAHIGPGQVGHPEVRTPWYNDASSAIGAPTFSLPLLSVNGLPLGIQMMGFEGHDAKLASLAHWMLLTYAPQLV